ncbi:hypothetical protein BCV70DRAFT_224003 [Testicularia cyperi]|uniref:LrgB-domain-containing protein n=1 Tax=Testicularia cyperi TaxID=1882483 RepID=A0A317XLL8_9BASI|nr:hypothetical protein BCV70DRAFT_224003 [Testicularia cyperi]
MGPYLLPTPATHTRSNSPSPAATLHNDMDTESGLHRDYDATRRPSTDSTSSGSSGRSSISSTSSCRSRVDHIRSPSHVISAFKLMWYNKKSDLFVSWIHVPIGITSLLAFVWVIKLGMDQAPFRFPSPVLAMVALFGLLLFLDWLSTQPFIQRRLASEDADAEPSSPSSVGIEGPNGLTKPVTPSSVPTKPLRKVLLAPALAILEPPCDFCLRYMSVMFTPSFILIPARELISGREIGIITGWFAATQILALLFPVYLHRLIRFVIDYFANYASKKADKKRRKFEHAASRRASLATIVSITGQEPDQLVDEKTVKPRAKMGLVATGLSGVTAIATAPLVGARKWPGHSEQDQEPQDEDHKRQMTHVQLETARQQGDPYVTSPRTESWDPFRGTRTVRPSSAGAGAGVSPRAGPNHSPMLEQFDGIRPHHFFTTHRHSHLGHAHGGAVRSRSMTRDSSIHRASKRSGSKRRPGSSGNRPSSSNGVVGRGSALRHSTRGRSESPPPRATGTEQAATSHDIHPTQAISPTFDQYIFEARRQARTRSKLADTPIDPNQDTCPPTMVDSQKTMHSSQSPTKMTFDGEDEKCDKPKIVTEDLEAQRGNTTASEDGQEIDDEPDAVERLSERFADAITPTVFLVLLVAGLPVFYLTDISLPLFLAINLITFLVSITLVPPKIRRYAHPILTTSVATLLILWGLGEARGWSLKQTLSSYSVDAKYSVLWSIDGYRGPVIGAGDVLFSTLDAGIVSLAIPMYRYRRDLKAHFWDMLYVLFPCALLSVFVWPSLAHVFGIAPERALSFASRFMSTPLAIELSLTIGADESITVILVVITGILISVFKDNFWRLVRVDQDDALTIGIAMGSTAGAIGASSLIAKPKIMAIASLSFVLFGTILLVFAAIPPIVDIWRSLAGASGPVAPL